MSIESVRPSNHLILCCQLLLLPSVFPSIRIFQRVSSSHQVAKVLEFQLQHQSFQWTPGLISFRMDWLDLLRLKINLIKEAKDLYTGNNKKENEEDWLMRDIPCIWIRINIVKVSILPKATYRFNEIRIKIELFTEIEKN